MACKKKDEEDEKDENAKIGPGIEPPSNAVSVMTTPRRQRHTHRATGPDTTFFITPATIEQTGGHHARFIITLKV